MSRRSTRTRKTRQAVPPENSEDEGDAAEVSSRGPSSDHSFEDEAPRRRHISAPETKKVTDEDAKSPSSMEKRRASDSSIPPSLGSQNAEATETVQPDPSHTSPEPDRPRWFHLNIVQQPQKALAAGLSMNTLGRLPLVPVPIVQLLELDEEGNWLDEPPSPTISKTFFCSCSLLATTDDDDGALSPERNLEPVDWVDPVVGDGKLQALIGQLHCDLKHVPGLDGRPAAYFGQLISSLIPEMVRVVDMRSSLWRRDNTTTGQVQNAVLRLRRVSHDFVTQILEESELSRAYDGSARFASTLSDAFVVYDRPHYPGDLGVSDLTRHLYDSGIRIYMPALEDPELLAG